MAKKVAKAKKPTSSQVVVKVTGGALPSSLCFVAGRLIARAQWALNVAYRANTAKASSRTEKTDLMAAALTLRAVRENFPLTAGSISPIERKLDKLVKGKVSDAAVQEVYKQATRELAILEGKAMQGCNVNRV